MRRLLSSLRNHLILAILAIAVIAAPPALRGQAPFVRGDSNGTGEIDISDAVFTLVRLFASGEPFPCEDSADTNDDGGIDISDAIGILAYQFLGGAAPAQPFPGCGADPSPSDPLGCERSPASGCPTSGPSGLLVKLLAAISLDGTEPCCLPGLGLYAVRAGKCASLGGTPAGDAGCVEAPAPAPGLLWRRLPPVTAVDPYFPVEVVPAGGLDFDHLTLDLYKVEGTGALVGPMRVGEGAVARSGSGWLVNAGALPKGEYTLRATAWKRAAADAGAADVTVDLHGEAALLGDVVEGEVPVAVIDLPAAFRAHPTAAETLSMAELADLGSYAPAGDPVMGRLLAKVQAAEDMLRAVEASLSSPAIEALRRRIRDLEAQRAAAAAAGTDAAAALEDAQRRLDALRRELEALVLVNRYLDTYFDEDDLEELEDLIRRREEILSGAAQDDRKALDEALEKKRERKAEVEAALADKSAKLEQLKKDHAAKKDAVRAQFHTTRRSIGDNFGRFSITDGEVTYEVVGILVTGGGKGYVLYAPYGDRYKEEKAKLDALIEEYKGLWKAIQDCEKEIADLEKEKEWLEANISKLEGAAGEVEEIDEVLDAWFGPLGGAAPQAPHLRDLIDRLRETGNGWLADLLEQLFGSVPRTPEELEDFARRLQALRAAKHAREAEVSDQIRRAEDEARDAERRIEEEEARRRELEEATREAEERLRKAEEEARRAAEEEYRRQQAAAEEEARRQQAERELEERINKLRERAQAGDEEALKDLAILLGLTLLDELVEGLPLGSMIGGLLTIAEMPECACEILKAMLALFSDRGEFRVPLASEVIRLFRECAGLPGISSVELGASQLAQAVDRMPRDARRRVCEALQRAIRARGCN
ncbi:MAG: hypothetical protein HY721_18955 [Planctomycetes bacterium]|nr:hypothetical protein [Planctomycetota bacterium]